MILIFALSLENKWTELVQKAEKTVVHIVSLKKNNDNLLAKNHSEGSGFMFQIEGSVITNHHIIADSDQIIISSEDGTVFSAELIGSDPILFGELPDVPSPPDNFQATLVDINNATYAKLKHHLENN